MQVRVGLENGFEGHRSMAWAFDVPGCIAYGTDSSDALLHFPTALVAFTDWANRHAGSRAAVLHHTTDARLTRAHNNANVACFGARLTGVELAEEALRVFLTTEYEGGRHDRRLGKITPKA